VAGIALAALMYLLKPGMADAFAGRVGGLYRLVYNKYFVDEMYDAAVVRPLVGGSREMLWKLVDGAMIDGLVNGVASRARDVGGVLQRIQSGNIRSYATWVVFGAVMLIFMMGLAGGLIR
jgi:NADH-quinone oxidoreductase subunit L